MCRKSIISACILTLLGWIGNAFAPVPPDGAFDGKTTHTYTKEGVYNVDLTVTDDDGATDTATATVTVEAVLEAEMVAAFAFGSRLLDCTTHNDPSVSYTIVYHGTPDDIKYDQVRGYGYEVLYPTGSPYGNRGGYGQFGPFDDSPNNRNEFPDTCPEELYDSFIGSKNFITECAGDPATPCVPAEGIIFRIDVPNGTYRFVGAFGEADNPHAHRILAEDGGSGPPPKIGSNYVVLVHNFDQAQYKLGETDPAEPGKGVYARVGFDGKIPPPGDGKFPSPQFVDMDQNGMDSGEDCSADSPTLQVTQGYIRIHQLQGTSNDGPGGTRGW